MSSILEEQLYLNGAEQTIQVDICKTSHLVVSLFFSESRPSEENTSNKAQISPLCSLLPPLTLKTPVALGIPIVVIKLLLGELEEGEEDIIFKNRLIQATQR